MPLGRRAQRGRGEAADAAGERCGLAPHAPAAEMEALPSSPKQLGEQSQNKRVFLVGCQLRSRAARSGLYPCVGGQRHRPGPKGGGLGDVPQDPSQHPGPAEPPAAAHLWRFRGRLLFLMSSDLMCSASRSSCLMHQCRRMLVVNWSSGWHGRLSTIFTISSLGLQRNGEGEGRGRVGALGSSLGTSVLGPRSQGRPAAP